MKFLKNNRLKFKDQNILLLSPDADLILLSMIQSQYKHYICVVKQVNTKETDFDFKYYELSLINTQSPALDERHNDFAGLAVQSPTTPLNTKLF